MSAQNRTLPEVKKKVYRVINVFTIRESYPWTLLHPVFLATVLILCSPLIRCSILYSYSLMDRLVTCYVLVAHPISLFFSLSLSLALSARLYRYSDPLPPHLSLVLHHTKFPFSLSLDLYFSMTVSSVLLPLSSPIALCPYPSFPLSTCATHTVDKYTRPNIYTKTSLVVSLYNPRICSSDVAGLETVSQD